jgi:hypothetical protein
VGLRRTLFLSECIMNVSWPAGPPGTCIEKLILKNPLGIFGCSVVNPFRCIASLWVGSLPLEMMTLRMYAILPNNEAQSLIMY